MMSERDNVLALYLGNLHRGCKVKELKQRIIDLYTQIGIPIAKKNVHVIAKPNTRFAFVSLDTVADFHNSLAALTRNIERFDITGVVNPGEKLKVARKRPKKDQSSRSNTVNADIKESDDSNADSVPHKTRYLDQDLCSPKQENGGYSVRTFQHISSERTVQQNQYSKRKSSSSHQLNNCNNLRELPMDMAPQNAMSDTVLVYHGANAHGHVAPNLVSTFKYIQGRQLGNETRNIEFKCGQGVYIKTKLVPHVSKYMCAFLNTDGGTLVIGVSDDGTVKGIPGIDRRTEDGLRTKIDSAVKAMSPKVFPSMYRTSFIDVLDSSGCPIENLKVIEVEVEKGRSSQLYETDRGEVYIRRDGSVQGPLKASDIQEWTRLQMSRQLEKVNKEIEDLQLDVSQSAQRSDKHSVGEEMDRLKQSRTRLENAMHKLEKDNEQLELRARELENERDFYKRESENRRSKVCSIS